MQKFLLFLFIIFLSLRLSAQSKPAIPLMRKVFHEDVDKTQKAIDKLDKKEDRSFKGTADIEVNQQVSYTLFNKVDRLQDYIEADSSLRANDKIKFLRSLNEALVSFENGYRRGDMKADQLPDLMSAFIEAMSLERKGQSIKQILVDNDFEIS